MDLMARLLRPPRGASIIGIVAAVATGVAIFAFAAPPVIIVPISWAAAITSVKMKPWIVRHLDSR